MGHEGHEHDPGHSHEPAHGHREGHRPVAGPGSAAGAWLHLDCFSGVSGDMLLGALADLGVPEDVFHAAVRATGVGGFALRFEPAEKHAIGATRAVVEVAAGEQPQRRYRDIRALLERSTLGSNARALALATFHTLAEAESRIHRVGLDDVHFHEVGAIDAIVDIVGTCAAVEHLGARMSCSPLPLGRGLGRSAHGAIPIPPPAVLEILRDRPVRGDPAEVELVTPTGAALVVTLCERFGEIPPMRPLRVGYGAGTRDLEDRPNLLRAILGAVEPDATDHVVLEANIDDMTPEIAAYVVETLLAAGALDAWYAPIVMKKGRPGVQLGVLCRTGDREALTAIVLRESTTIGLRHYPVGRTELERRSVVVTTEFGPIPVKEASGGGASNAAPEFEACREAAAAHGAPLKDVYAAALAAWRAGRR